MFSKKFLIVEDDKQISEIISRICKEEGGEARSVNEPSLFVPEYAEFKPDIIILDIIMPEMDGFEIIRYLSENRSQAKIIILSGQESYRHMAEKMAASLDVNIVDNIPKPFRIANVRHTIQSLSDQKPYKTATA